MNLLQLPKFLGQSMGQKRCGIFWRQASAGRLVQPTLDKLITGESFVIRPVAKKGSKFLGASLKALESL